MKLQHDTDQVSAAEVRESGAQVAKLLLHPTHRESLAADRDTPLILIHDEEASRIPWETLRFGEKDEYLPASAGYLGNTRPRIYPWPSGRSATARRTAAPAARGESHGDLAGAEEEGGRVRNLFEARRDVSSPSCAASRPRARGCSSIFARAITISCTTPATRSSIPSAPDRGGLICAPLDWSILRCSAVPTLRASSQLPILVFLNACEAGRVRGGAKKPAKKPAKNRSVSSRCVSW